MLDDNPYQPPTSGVVTAPADNGKFIEGGRSVPAGNFVGWITSAWALFMQSPVIWIVNAVIFMVIMVVLQLVPIIGGIIGALLAPVMIGSLMLGCRAQEDGRALEVGDLFTAFQGKVAPLVIVGALNLAASLAVAIVLGIVVAIVVGASGAMGMLAGGADAMAGLIGTLGIAAVLLALLFFVLMLLFFMAFWYAGPLVALQDVSPINAIGMSFKACIKNIVPFILYSIACVILFVLGALPLFLGLLVVVPLLLISTYTSFKDIFITE